MIASIICGSSRRANGHSRGTIKVIDCGFQRIIPFDLTHRAGKFCRPGSAEYGSDAVSSSPFARRSQRATRRLCSSILGRSFRANQLGLGKVASLILLAVGIHGGCKKLITPFFHSPSCKVAGNIRYLRNSISFPSPPQQNSSTLGRAAFMAANPIFAPAGNEHPPTTVFRNHSPRMKCGDPLRSCNLASFKLARN